MEHALDSRQNFGVLKGVVPAALLTAGLFLAMNALITVDEIEFSEKSFRPFEVIVPQEDVIDPIRPADHSIEKIVVIPPPQERALDDVPTNLDDVFGPVQIEEPIVDANIGSLKDLIPKTIVVGPAEARPIRAPVSVYPTRALEQGKEGSCEVFFSIDAAGRPFNIDARCTDRVFKSPSEKAVRKSQFSAPLVEGQPVGQDNLVFPIVYNIID